ncbi:MAG TPA: hypothetical protein VF282_02935, partial [Bacillota bacterium]
MLDLAVEMERVEGTALLFKGLLRCRGQDLGVDEPLQRRPGPIVSFSYTTALTLLADELAHRQKQVGVPIEDCV